MKLETKFRMVSENPKEARLVVYEEEGDMKQEYIQIKRIFICGI